MSHFKERKEKSCLNCHSEVHGRFCHVCGQENVEPVETAWQLVTHFFNDLTHFDGKFFNTLGRLIVKPGFISKEYMMGRRARYLNPIRMYIFTSALFFLVFFSVTDFSEKNLETKVDGKSLSEIALMDSVSFYNFTKEINDGTPLTREGFKAFLDSAGSTSGLQFTPNNYSTKAAYDSALKSGIKKHNWLEKKLTYKQIEVNEKFNHDRSRILSGFINSLLHSFPQMFFVSLPLFALLLKLLYIKRKEYYYAAHIIFSFHLYIFIFILMLIILGLFQLSDVLNWKWLRLISLIGIFYGFIYEYKAMRRFYEQGRGKTMLKFFLLNFFMLFLFVFLIVIFIFLSLFNM